MRRSVKLKKHGRMSPQNFKKCTDLAPIDAIMQSADAVGNPSKQGKGGVVGYLSWLATKEPRAFASLLGRALPSQKTVDPGVRVEEVNLDNVKELFAEKLTRVAQRMREDPLNSE
jgi:hypothetical protein